MTSTKASGLPIPSDTRAALASKGEDDYMNRVYILVITHPHSYNPLFLVMSLFHIIAISY